MCTQRFDADAINIVALNLVLTVIPSAYSECVAALESHFPAVSTYQSRTNRTERLASPRTGWYFGQTRRATCSASALPTTAN